MAKFTNRGIVILYQGMALTSDVEEALLQVIAPFVHSGSKADIFQLNSSDIAIAAASKAVDNGKIKVVVSPEQTTPENEAAKLIGVTFEDSLKTKNPIIFALRLVEAIQYCVGNPSDTAVATLRALKLAAKPGFIISVDSKELKKYNITSKMLDVIRNVLTAKGISYE